MAPQPRFLQTRVPFREVQKDGVSENEPTACRLPTMTNRTCYLCTEALKSGSWLFRKGKYSKPVGDSGVMASNMSYFRLWCSLYARWRCSGGHGMYGCPSFSGQEMRATFFYFYSKMYGPKDGAFFFPQLGPRPCQDALSHIPCYPAGFDDGLLFTLSVDPATLPSSSLVFLPTP